MYCSNCGSDMGSSTCDACGHDRAFTLSKRDDVATGLVLAGFWRRGGSRLADDILLLFPGIAVFAFLIEVSTVTVGTIAVLALNGIYVISFLSGPNGQTLGGRLTRTRVRDARSGSVLSLQQACLRWGFVTAYGAIELAGHEFSYLVVALSLIDNLYQLIDQRRQTLHDKFAGTIVVMA